MNPVFFVPGFSFDPQNPDHSPDALFAMWATMLDRPTIGHPWYSVPLGFWPPSMLKHLWKAWTHGRAHRYRWAWDLAEAEGAVLRERLQDGRCDILAHSLGSRVVLEALSQPCNVGKVIFLNGAEHVSKALEIANFRSDIQFLNVAVTEDDVLHGPGAWASPVLFSRPTLGQKGLRKKAPLNWSEVFLDNVYFQDWGRAKGYDLKGDNPRSWGDHWFSYLWEGNWQLYRDFLDGSLDDIPRI